MADPFNVFTFEQEAMALLDRLFVTHDTVIATGGSGLYIEALCHGIAYMPDPPAELRQSLQHKLETEGASSLRQMLLSLDPEYYAQVDLANGVRLQRALEVCLTTGRPYSEVVKQPKRPRPFEVETIVIERSREDLRSRINQRVDLMLSHGLEEEVRRLYPSRHLTVLNTVGYKEFFSYWAEDAAAAVSPAQLDDIGEAIKLNTWHYAKKQLTWLKKYAPTLRSRP